ncbi:hypothetical protein NQ318_019578 [Aromia moschata]|uniref:Uncharacterized protein n=1 Tax=Aromia moschata TaxID=1265417 RepID=A0AAV8Z3X6_9CUCU|nr:hypothetical protein NQ318_019578 [Aromia moschata]
MWKFAERKGSDMWMLSDVKTLSSKEIADAFFFSAAQPTALAEIFAFKLKGSPRYFRRDSVN